MMRRIHRYIRSALILFIPVIITLTGSKAQTPEDFGFQRITPGNLSMGAYSLLQDSRGFIWIGHEFGLSRYDGTTFTAYTHPQQSALAISHLREDRDGRIWCANFNGQLFYIEQDRMHLFHPSNPNLNFIKFGFFKNELLAIYNKGLFIYNLDSHEEKTITHTSGGLKIKLVSDLYIGDSVTYILMHSGHDKHVVQYESGILKDLNPNIQDPKAFHIISAGTRHIILKSETKSNRFTRYDIKSGGIFYKNSFTLRDDSYFLIASRNGEHSWVHTQKLSFPLNGGDTIRNLSLTSYLEDREGNTWATSLLYGLLLKKRTPPWAFHAYAESNERIIRIDTFNGQLVTLTQSGILSISDSFQSGNKKHIRLNQGATAGFIHDKDLILYGSNSVLYIDPSLRVHHRYECSQSLNNACIVDSGFYVFATHAGLLAIPRKYGDSAYPNGIITSHFSYDSYDHAYINLQGKRARALAYDPFSNTLFVGFSHGLYMYNASTSREIRLNGAPVYSYSIKVHGSQVYAATINNGILIIENGRIRKQITSGDGLLSPTVMKLKIAGNHLWILGTGDIQLFNLDRQEFNRNITLPSLKGTEVYDLMEWNKQVLLSTMEGIYKVPLEQEELHKTTLPLNYLYSVIANTTDTLKDGERLSWQKNNLQFNLAGLYYNDPSTVYFDYRLLGSENDTLWKRSAPGQHSILLSYLKPGKYLFEAVAKTGNGLSAPEKIRFEFTILKPWWLQTWFILASVFAATGTLLVIFRVRFENKKKHHRQVVEKLQYENALNDSELKALKSQMNPHFIFNSLNIIQELFMWGDKNIANEQLANFAMLTRAILTISEKKSISLSTEVDILKRYLELEKMRFRNHFEYEIVMDEDIDEGYIQIPPMIIQPFVENSIKHGLLHKKGHRKISITFQPFQDNEFIICTVRDNGIGRKKAGEIRSRSNYGHNSYSTEAIQKRLRLIYRKTDDRLLVSYSDLKDDNGNPGGTSVRIMIPAFV